MSTSTHCAPALAAAALCSTLILTSCADGDDADPDEATTQTAEEDAEGQQEGAGSEGSVIATAEVTDVAGNAIGVVEFSDVDDDVLVHAEVENLNPGFHGIALHENGVCEPQSENEAGEVDDFLSSGDVLPGDPDEESGTVDGEDELAEDEPEEAEDGVEDDDEDAAEEGSEGGETLEEQPPEDEEAENGGADDEGTVDEGEISEEGTPEEGAPGEQAPGEQAPEEQAPGEQVPEEQTPGEQVPDEQAPEEQVPGNQPPADDGTGGGAPGEQGWEGEPGVDEDQGWEPDQGPGVTPQSQLAPQGSTELGSPGETSAMQSVGGGMAAMAHTVPADPEAVPAAPETVPGTHDGSPSQQNGEAGEDEELPRAERAGAMPNLLVNADGTGELQFLSAQLSPEMLADTSVIITGDADNHGNIPERYAPEGADAETFYTGDTGLRMACGVVESDN